MKKILFTVFITTAAFFAKAQSAPSFDISLHIAQKMKDSLGLSSTQKDQIYALNQQLTNSKHLVRQQNTNMDSIRVKMQRVENTRDALYATVLTSSQFATYQQKKAVLISRN